MIFVCSRGESTDAGEEGDQEQEEEGGGGEGQEAERVPAETGGAGPEDGGEW